MASSSAHRFFSQLLREQQLVSVDLLFLLWLPIGCVLTLPPSPFLSLHLQPHDCAKRKKFSHHHPGAHGHRCLPGTHPPHPPNLCLLPSPFTHLLLLRAPLAQSHGGSHRAQPWRRGSRWRGHRWGRGEQQLVVAAVARGGGRRGLAVGHEQHGHLHRDRQL